VWFLGHQTAHSFVYSVGLQRNISLDNNLHKSVMTDTSSLQLCVYYSGTAFVIGISIITFLMIPWQALKPLTWDIILCPVAKVYVAAAAH